MDSPKRFLFAAAWLVALFALSVRAERPNIVVLLSDDAGYNEFSMHGSQLFPTPRIDSIAANGVRFSNGYVSGAVCSPTRAGLLTGRYQHRFGHEFNIPPVYSETNGLSLQETTLPDVLRNAGYRTIALGKWHLGYAPKFHPMERGFTDYYGFLQGSRRYFPLEKPTRLNRMLRDREAVTEKFEYMTDELGRAAADYIAQSKDQPFFMYVAFNATHGPLDALDSDLAQVEGSGRESKLRAMTIALDRAVGVILDELQRHALTENTLVVFLNDNGGATGHDNAPLRGRKGTVWEGGIRVPFAVQWPAKLPPGKVFDHPVISLDIFPTAMVAAGVEESPGQLLDGVDLVPFLTGGKRGRPHPTLYWKHGSHWAVRDGDFKLVGGDPASGRRADGSSTSPQLFNLAEDLSETNDLAATDPETVSRMQTLYEEWKRDFPETPWRRGTPGQYRGTLGE